MEISSLIPVATLLIGSFLTYYFGIRAKRDEAAHKYKEEQYAKLLIKLQGFVGSTSNADTKREFFEEQYKSWLYCSDEVIKSINIMVALVVNGRGEESTPEEGRKAVGNIVIAMRKDLRGKANLEYRAFRYTDVR